MLFVRKLKLIMIKSGKHKESSMQSMPSTSGTNPSLPSQRSVSETVTSPSAGREVDPMQTLVDNDLLYVVIKHGVLVPFAIVSSFICFTLDVVVALVMGPDEFHAAAAFWFALDCLISSMCTAAAIRQAFFQCNGLRRCSI